MVKRRAMGRRPAVGFTLIELLVVIGIIAVLMAILLPALSRARQEAYKVNCAATLRQWGNAVNAFASDHNNRFPKSGGWQQAPQVHDDLLHFNNNDLRSEWHHEFLVDYLTGYDEADASAGEAIIHRCPVETRHQSFRRDTISYYYLAHRSVTGPTSYESDVEGWVSRQTLDGPYSRAPFMADEYARTQDGELASQVSSHISPGNPDDVMGSNFLYEDTSVRWENQDQIDVGGSYEEPLVGEDVDLYFHVPVPGLID